MILKQFIEKNGATVCRVTFTLPSRVWAGTIHLVGDFNNWNPTSHPLKHRHDGAWTVTLDLECGRSYQFRYLCDGRDWINDNQADQYLGNPFGSDNSLLVTDPAFQRGQSMLEPDVAAGERAG